LDQIKPTLIIAFVSTLLFVPAASAQATAPNASAATAAKVAVISGSGQLICPNCPFKPNTIFFSPMVVKVTDANGNPIAGKTVNWTLVSSTALLPPTFDVTSTTDSSGLAFSRPSQNANQGGTVVQPFLQSVIKASADGASANFTETLALTDSNTGFLIIDTADLIAPTGTPITGAAGSIGVSPVQIHVAGFGTPVPGVSVRLLSAEVTSASGQVTLDPSFPSASCVTSSGAPDPGADPGAVLTDTNGIGTCYPVFGPTAGSGFVAVLIAGLDPIQFDQSLSPIPLTSPIAFFEFPGIQLIVTQVAPGRINPVSGNNATVNPGQSATLVVQVTDATGKVTIANQDVTWTVVGAATVNPAVSKTDSTGTAQTTVTLSPSATGQVTVTAALTGGNNGITTTFTLSTRILIGNLGKVSGDLQTTQSGQSFPLPLVVQVLGTNGQPLSNQSIGFAVTTGAATAFPGSQLTDAQGEARTTVTAGSTPGNVIVTAFVGTFSQTFSLTVIPPGPALSSNSFYNAGGLTKIGALSPCGLVTVFASGLAPNVQGMVFNTNSFGPWATTLVSDTVTVASVNAPIYSVGNVNGAEQLTFEVPCETAIANSVPITINVGGGNATITFPVVAASPGIFETAMSDGVHRAVVVRPDGTFVSLQNPARRGETVRVFATGLGATNPLMVTGSVPVPGADSLALAEIIVGVNNSGARVITSRVSPSLIGVFEITFQVPSDAPTGNDVVVNVAVNALGDTQTRFSNGSKLPIQ
jgi:uncharacterized protein (TIGR03437 family)